MQCVNFLVRCNVAEILISRVLLLTDGEAAAAQNLDDLQTNGSVQLLYLL